MTGPIWIDNNFVCRLREALPDQRAHERGGGQRQPGRHKQQGILSQICAAAVHYYIRMILRNGGFNNVLDMIATDCSLIHPDLSGKVGFDLPLGQTAVGDLHAGGWGIRPLLETCMLVGGDHEHCWNQ